MGLGWHTRMGWHRRGTAALPATTFAGDVTLAAGKTLFADKIDDAGAGTVTVLDDLIASLTLSVTGASTLFTTSFTDNVSITAGKGLKVDAITDSAGGNTVSVNGVKLKLIASGTTGNIPTLNQTTVGPFTITALANIKAFVWCVENTAGVTMSEVGAAGAAAITSQLRRTANANEADLLITNGDAITHTVRWAVFQAL
jgi:hypothetical protein